MGGPLDDKVGQTCDPSACAPRVELLDLQQLETIFRFAFAKGHVIPPHAVDMIYAAAPSSAAAARAGETALRESGRGFRAANVRALG